LAKIQRLLIANRGEIAVRIIRACREADVESVAVYSDADERAVHVLAADRAVRLGPAPAAESYLSVRKIIEAARTSEADAVHPGYGFLSENPALAGACAEAGLIFVGPPADVISKIGARRLMERAGVPVVPGVTPSDQSDAGIVSAVESVGLPALVKPSSGGGGKGMRAIRALDEAWEAVAAARREALAAFGDGTLYVERLVERPRHVEIQVFADAEGHAVHLFERECSVQRRHQKIIEESPSLAVTPALRTRMGEAAVAAARAAGYRNAGTIEFLLEGSGDAASFYFLEMNTRLQVEHPVTEAVAGIDIVRAQLDVAGGAPLPWTQSTVVQRGHAIECRVYAEDPASGFLPQAGRILLYREPAGPGIRVDSGIAEGSDVTVHYDPLLAKVVAFAETRDAAIARAAAALRAYPILGIRTNVAFLGAILAHPSFRAGEISTAFVDERIDELVGGDGMPPEVEAAARAYRAVGSEPSEHARPEGRASAAPDPWTGLTGWGR
jgi:acetyl-CoA/propionyl-CoA carboxylase, biotin carboxylase, biotin carboxyl carrier protein